MKDGKIPPFSNEKIIIKRKPFPKINITKNLHLMNLPEFHLNRTIKAYINEKLNKSNLIQNPSVNNNSYNKIQVKPLPKDTYNNLTRIKTMTNIMNHKKSPDLNKKIYKSKSKTKFNISSYLLKIKKSSIKNSKEKLINNSGRKYNRNIRSTNLSNNVTNQPNNKTVSIYHQDNQIGSNNSTLDFPNKKKKSLLAYTTSKKHKQYNKFFPENKKIKIKFGRFNKIKNKTNQIKEIIMNNKNINNNIDINLENSFIKKSFNNVSEKNNRVNLNYINNTENNIIYSKSESNHIYFQDCNINDKTLSKINNISNMGKSIDIYMNNISKDVKDNSKTQDNNSFIYIQKIEKLENENKFLKDEINNSKNKLQLLEEKINKLLIVKNRESIRKEECPQPTPYVKKYSNFNSQNIYSNFT